MAATDRFGGSAAWDRNTAVQDATIAILRCCDPGCGECGLYVESEGAASGTCLESNESVPAFGWVPCEYESYEFK